MGVGALVDVEVMVRRERRHPQVDGVGRLHLGERLAAEPREDLPGGRRDVGTHRLDRAREVVVRLEIAAHELERGFHLLADRGEDELVAPHGVPPELALVRLDQLGDEPAPAPGGPERRGDVAGTLGGERGPQLLVVADLVLHAPERLDGVPVAIGGRVLEPAEQDLVDTAAGLLHHRPQLQRGGQLGEVEHPVDLPVAIVDVDRVLEQARDVGQAHPLDGVEAALEEREVAFHLGPQPVPPPIGEVPAIDRQDRVKIRAHRRGKGGVARNPGGVSRAVLGAFDPHVRIGWDRGRVDVAVDVLGQPVDGERRAEAPEHVVAAEPPPADVEEHRAHRVRDVQVVVDPEEILLDLGIPGHRE